MDAIHQLFEAEKTTCRIVHMYQPYFDEDIPKWDIRGFIGTNVAYIYNIAGANMTHIIWAILYDWG